MGGRCAVPLCRIFDKRAINCIIKKNVENEEGVFA